MGCFKELLRLELARVLVKRNMFLFILFLALLLIFLQMGISEYKKLLENKIDFQESENQRIQQYILYTQYGGYGIRILFLPDPMSVLFSNPTVNDMVSSLNVAETLTIVDNLLGEDISPGPGGYMNFAGIILLILSLLALFYGSDLYNREYLKFIASISKHPIKLFLMMLILKAIILHSLFLILVVCTLLYLLINGIYPFNISFLCFVMVSILILTFFLLLGSLICTIRQKSKRTIVLFVIYFVFVFFIPAALVKVSVMKTREMESNYKLELKKLKIVMSLEEKSLKRIGLYQSGNVAPERVKKLLTEFIIGEYKKLKMYEDKVRNDLIANMKYTHILSTIFPSAFYLFTSSEISSTGASNIIEFYDYTREMKNKFFNFYIHKKFYEKSVPGKLESFIKGNENIFSGKSKLPHRFGYGLLFNIFYIIILLVLSFIGFRKYLFARSYGSENLKRPINLEKGKSRVILTASPEIKDVIYNYFFGSRKEFPGEILLDNKKLDPSGVNFIFICHPGQIPGEFKVKNFLKCIFILADVPVESWFKDLKSKEILDKRLIELGDMERAKVLLYGCEIINPEIIIFNEFEKDMPESDTQELVELIKDIKARDSVIIYFTRNITFGSKIFDGDIIVPPPVDHIKV